MEKQYVVRKYVMAKNITDALKKEKDIAADDIWLNEEWLRNNLDFNKVGFKKK